MIRTSYFINTRTGEPFTTEYDDCSPIDNLQEEIPIGYTEDLDSNAFNRYFGENYDC